MNTVNYRLVGSKEVRTTDEASYAKLIKKHPRSFVRVKGPKVSTVTPVPAVPKPETPAKGTKNSK